MVMVMSFAALSRRGRVYEEEHHAAVQQLTMMSHKLVVMTETMRATLDSFHAMPPHRYAVIPHGWNWLDNPRARWQVPPWPRYPYGT